MQSLSELLSNLGAWNWFILACALLILEFAIPGVHFLWFGLAAVFAGTLMILLTSFAPVLAASITWPIQLIIYALISMAIVFLVRRYAIGLASPAKDSTLNARSAQYVGRTALIEVPISGGRGKVRISDTLWIAKGADVPKGTRVKVVGYDGPVLLVEPVD